MFAVGAAVLSGPPSAYAPTVTPSNSLPCQREVARRSRDGRIPSPRPKAFPWGKVVPQGPDKGNAEGLGTLASERI